MFAVVGPPRVSVHAESLYGVIVTLIFAGVTVAIANMDEFAPTRVAICGGVDDS